MAGVRCIYPSTVSQQELETAIGVANQIKTLQKLYNRKAAAILSRLLAGCAVERGTHEVEIEWISAGSGREQRLVIR